MTQDSLKVKPTCTAIVPYQFEVSSAKTFLETRVDNQCRKTLKMVGSEAQDLKQIESGRIIVLLGQSTAGKTSIIKELEKQIPGVLGVGLDEYIPEQASKFLQEREPELYGIMARALVGPIDIAEGVFGMSDRILWKKDASQDECQAAQKAILQAREKVEEMSEEMEDLDAKLIGHVIEASQRHPGVVFDPQPGLMEQFLERSSSASVKIGLVYCPFTELPIRIALRNTKALGESGDPKEWRAPIHPIMQFLDYYRPAKPGEPVVDTLHRAEVESIFEKAFDDHYLFFSALAVDAANILVDLNSKIDSGDKDLSLATKEQRARSALEEGKKECEKARKEHDEMKDRLMTGLGFSDAGVDSVGITSKFQGIQHVFNTKISKPADSVGFIRSWES